MSITTGDPVFQPNADIVFTELDDSEFVLLDLRTRKYFTVNETGGRIWKLLVGGLDVPAIATAITEEFAISPEEAAPYVVSFLDELASQGLVRRMSSSGGQV